MKCTKKKIFYRDENQMQTLQWWFQLWLANVRHLMVGYKTSEGIVDQIDFLSQRQFISKFLSKFDLKLHFCLSYLYSFLELIGRTSSLCPPSFPSATRDVLPLVLHGVPASFVAARRPAEGEERRRRTEETLLSPRPIVLSPQTTTPTTATGENKDQVQLKTLLSFLF